MDIYRISDLNIAINTRCSTIAESIKRYKVDYQEVPNITLGLSDDRMIELMEEYEGYTADMIETMALSTLYCWALFDFNGFPIRATAVEYEDRCILFASPYNEDFDPKLFLPQDKVFVYDYPAIRLEGDTYYAFDTPFGVNGMLSKPGRKLPLESIVFIDANCFDSLRKLESKDFVPMFMRAVAQNVRQERTKHSLFILGNLMHKVKFFGIREVSPYDIDFILERV